MQAPTLFQTPIVFKAVALSALLLTGNVVAESNSDITRVQGHVLKPSKSAIEDITKHVRLPEGFKLSVFADNLINPRMIVVADDGTVYVTRREVGDVLMLKDNNNDGRADERKSVAHRPGMHGIALDGDDVYLATIKQVYKTQRLADGSFAPLKLLVDDLPDGGQHPNRTLAVSPDGMVYISVGSTCNACTETSPESAALLQMKPDGKSRKIFAQGLRNTIGFAFEPETGELYGMDHGIDWLGDNEQHEELNHLVQNQHYGWPYVYADSKFNPQDEPPGEISLSQWAKKSTEPVGFYTPHAAPMQMAFYTGDGFPKSYRGDAFIAMRGSWNRNPPSGYEVLRIDFEKGRPKAFVPFAQGFLTRDGDQWGHKGRLAGLAQTPDGALLISDDTNGVIYRIHYQGDGKEKAAATGEPTNRGDAKVWINDSPREKSKPLQKNGLAHTFVKKGTQNSLKVSAEAFEYNASIPTIYAGKGENISPKLTWQNAPKNTRSYVVIMEDPDAKQPPFVHWLIYNIPANSHSLAEGIPTSPQLAEPKGALQGLNDRGASGYFGPQPPKENPPHNYHFQVFALDKELDIGYGANRNDLITAMQNHVLAWGETIGRYDR